MQQISKNRYQGEEHDILSAGSATYTLLIDGDKAPSPENEQHFITVGSSEEAARYLALLGDACSLCLSPEFQNRHPELETHIIKRAMDLQGPEAPFDTQVAAGMMRKLPFDVKGLLKSPIEIISGNSEPCLIRKELVHKSNTKNVLISEPFSIGWVRYFNMFQDTQELRFDHASAHVQGMLIIEALRQAGIASAHLQGLPADGMLALMEYTTNFFSFVENSSPIVLRTYCSFTADETSADKEACIYLQVMQWGHVCAEAFLKAFACMNRGRCRQKEDRIEKIARRQKSLFESRIARVRETEKAY